MDFELAQFARVLALPIRVFIIRMIIEHDNSISKQQLYSHAFTEQNINKHLLELKAAGILKINGARGQITYSIDQNVSKQIAESFTNMFQSISQLNPRKVDVPQPVIVPAVFKNQKEEKEEHISSFTSFGAFIKKRRMELCLSQEDFSKKINIERAQLSRVECGKKSLNVDKLKELAQALYLDLDTVKKEYYQYRIAQLIEESKM
ncbi:MAG: helix-turn-helix transcriptional regulator [Mucilaginibacter sp.]|uniref:helix-turn-helix transcriptional regulator n=1 Tax=Mucilaginibacter sp. TaxID=1882438 RepID=UPI0031AE8C7F